MFMCRRIWWLGLHLPPSSWWGLHLPLAGFLMLAMTPCLTMGLALTPFSESGFMYFNQKRKNITITEGTMLRIWVLWSRWFLSYNAVLMPVNVSPVDFWRICLSWHSFINSFIHVITWSIKTGAYISSSIAVFLVNEWVLQLHRKRKTVKSLLEIRWQEHQWLTQQW